MTSSRSMPLVSLGLSLSLALAIGCTGRADPTPPDAGGTRDGGSTPLDASDIDGGALLDGSADEDASPADDAAVGTDAATITDAAADARAPDAASAPDAAAMPDACVPPPCPAPPEGCRYEGATLCTCGTLVCDSPGCPGGCAPGEYCDLCATPPGCAVRPPDMGLICPAVFMPVCGCDGMTYSNACVLGSAGIGQLHDGACTSSM